MKVYNERILAPGGFQLPNTAQQRIWKTDSGKANFTVIPGLEEDRVNPDPEVLTLTTLRSHDQYNTTIYGLDDRYRGVFGRRDVLFINQAELDRRGLQEGDVVDVATAMEHAHADRVVRGLMLVCYDLPDGCCASYYPETQPLIALEHVDPDSLTPSYKSIPVVVRPAGPAGAEEIVVNREGVAGVHPSQGTYAPTEKLSF